MTDDIKQEDLMQFLYNEAAYDRTGFYAPYLYAAYSRIDELEARLTSHEEVLSEKLEQIYMLEKRLSGVDAGTHVIVRKDDQRR